VHFWSLSNLEKALGFSFFTHQNLYHMPTTKINGVNLYWEVLGQQGDPLVLVHGSWGDHYNWNPVVDELSESFRVLTYDRRGHSKSERPLAQGSVEEDVADLVALIEYLGFSPAHIAGNSGGAAIVLKTAARRPDLFRTLIIHEPPLFGVLKNVDEAQPMLQVVESRLRAVVDLIITREYEQAAKLFVETIAFGPDAWPQLPESVRQTFIYNAPTFLDEINDPANLEFDTSGLSNFNKPALLTQGSGSAPFFAMALNIIAQALPKAKRFQFDGAGHVPHISHPRQYIKTLREFCATYQEV
jgi:pimeloyl-ACP methyl ester carboxylesterase